MQKHEEHMVNKLKTNVSCDRLLCRLPAISTPPPSHSVHVLLYHLSFYHSIYMLTHFKCSLLSLFLPLAFVYELHSQDTLKQPVAMLCPASYQYLLMHTLQLIKV